MHPTAITPLLLLGASITGLAGQEVSGTPGPRLLLPPAQEITLAGAPHRPPCRRGRGSGCSPKALM